MKKKYDFFALGYFGYSENKPDGQVVKTRSVYELFCQNLNQNIPFYDTQKLKKSKLSFIKAITTLIKAENIIYIPAHNNLKYFFPIIYFLSLVFKFNILLFTVGGWFTKFIDNHNWWKIRLRKIHVIYVQTTEIVDTLSTIHGFKNVVWIPNFRMTKNNKTINVKKNNPENLRMVFMSRINRMKGLDLIFDFFRKIENTELSKNLSLDFYGPINPPDQAFFEKNLLNFKNVHYKGILNPENVNKTLSEYDLLILPTKYYTEGFPGAILDAYNAGIPVIVTKWQYAKEFVLDGKTGYIIPFENGINTFLEKIHLLNNDQALLNMLKINALEFSQRFQPEFAWKIIKKAIKTPCQWKRKK